MVADELARYTEAEALVERSLAFSAEHRLDGLYLPILAARSTVRLERGDWAGALGDADVGGGPRRGDRGQRGAGPGDPRTDPRRPGGSRRPRSLLDQAARAAEGVGDVSMLVPVADARSEYFLWAGDADRAQREARHGLDLAGGSDGPALRGRPAGLAAVAGGRVRTSARRPVAEPYQLMIDGDWAGAAAAWAERGATYLRIEALAAGDRSGRRGGAAASGRSGRGPGREPYVRASLRKRGITASAARSAPRRPPPTPLG